MIIKERKWDRKLKIRTCGRDDRKADQYNYPYEPTPYCVLERIADHNLIGKENVLLDYGCGKGRVGIFFARESGCRTIGIDYNEKMIKIADKNLTSSGLAETHRVTFEKANAGDYAVPEEVDRIFFFNPFSEDVLSGALSRVMESWYGLPREVFLIFYYPSTEYLGALMTRDELMFYDEIDCSDLFAGDNSREKVLIFEIV